MNRTTAVILIAALTLGGCGRVSESRFNPFNWFGRSTSAPVEAGAGEVVNPLIPRTRRNIFFDDSPEEYKGTLIGQVTELRVERSAGGGAIISVTGIADRQGPYEIRLVKVEEESDASTLTYDLRNLQGPGAVGGSEWSRSVKAAVSLSALDLEGVRTIRIKAARNQQTSRR